MDELSQSQLERLKFIDFRLYFTGQIRRGDLIQRFGIKEAAATRDIAEYKRKVPDNIIYNGKEKIYLAPNSFKRHFIKEVEAKHLLLAFVHGIGDDFSTIPQSLVPCELPVRLHPPHIEIFAIISKAIHNKKAVKIKYVSQTDSKERVIVPSSFAGNGLRWHVRAFDRKREGFRDFVINRIEKAAILSEEKIGSHEHKDNDIQWNRIVELELVPHPAINSPKFVEIEHDIKDGVLKHNVRAALAGYILRLWNVDCSHNHSLRGQKDGKEYGKEYHLWLRNRPTLYGVDNLAIAPGYELP